MIVTFTPPVGDDLIYLDAAAVQLVCCNQIQLQTAFGNKTIKVTTMAGPGWSANTTETVEDVRRKLGWNVATDLGEFNA